MASINRSFRRAISTLLLAVLTCGALVVTPTAALSDSEANPHLDSSFGQDGVAELTFESLFGTAPCELTDPFAMFPNLDACTDQPVGLNVQETIPTDGGGLLIAGDLELWNYTGQRLDWGCPSSAGCYVKERRELFTAKLTANGQLDASYGDGGIVRVPVEDLSPVSLDQRRADCAATDRNVRLGYTSDSTACYQPEIDWVAARPTPEGGTVLVAVSRDAICRSYPFVGERYVYDSNGDMIYVDDGDEGENPLLEPYSSLIACPSEQFIAAVTADGAIASRAVSDLYEVKDDDPTSDYWPNGTLTERVLRGHPIYVDAVYDPAGWIVGTEGSYLKRFDLGAVLDPGFGLSNDHHCANCRQLHRLDDGRILGWSRMHGADELTVMRFEPDGERDLTYGEGGVARLEYPGTFATPEGHNVDRDITALVFDDQGRATGVGRDVVWTGQEQWPRYDWVAYRLTADGQVDASFGDGGFVHLELPYPYGEVYRAAAGADGKVVFGGYLAEDWEAQPGWWYGYAGLARLNLDGSLDTTFGTSGFVTAQFDVEGGWSEADLLTATDGEVYVGYDAGDTLLGRVGGAVCELAPLELAATRKLLHAPGLSPAAATAPPALNGWQIRGAFEQEGDLWVATGEVSLNGLALGGKGGADVTFTLDPTEATLAASGQVVVTAGPVEIAGHEVGPFTIYEGPLDWSFQSTEVRQAVAGGATVLGLATEGEAVLQALSTCAMMVELPTRLPGILGGGDAALSMTVDLEGGILPDTLTLAADQAVLGGLVKVSSPVLDYSSGDGWTMTSGQVDVGGEDIPLEGWLQHDEDGRPTAGHLSLASVPVAGLLTMPSLTLDYTAASRTWSGTMQAGEASGTAEFVYGSDGELSTADVRLSSVDLFGVLALRSFALLRAGDGAWSVDGRAEIPGGGKLSGALALDAEGAVRSGDIAATAVRFGETFDLRRFELSYASAGERWTAGAELVLPGASTTGVEVDFVFEAGAFVSGAVDVSASPGLPLGPGVGLTRLGAALDTDPWRFAGALAIEAGPNVGGAAAVRIDATGSVRFPTPTEPGIYEVNGDLTLASVPVASAQARYHTTPKLEFSGDLGGASGWALGPVTARATIAGTATDTAFNAKGAAELSLGALSTTGTLVANERGMAGCGALKAGWSWEAGFTYRWGATFPDTFGGGCDLGAWRALGLAGPQAVAASSVAGAARLRASSVGLASSDEVAFPVAESLPAVVVRAAGDTTAPAFTLTAPDGLTTYDATTAGVFEHHVVYHEDTTTIVAVNEPPAGAWTLEPSAGSAAITDLQIADGLPEASVTGSVAGTGSDRVLSWSLTPIAGQTVRFVEQGEGTYEVLGEVTAAVGELLFVPGDGPPGTRTIVAEVLQDGLPRTSIDVATFEADGTATLTVSVVGDGSGTVTGDVAGLPCTDECVLAVTYGSTVTLGGTPASGSVLGSWSGACNGDDATCEIVMSGPTTVTAQFAPAPADDPVEPNPGTPRPGEGSEPPVRTVTRPLPPGGTLSTAEGTGRPTAAAPVTAAVTTPTGGTVTVTQRGASTAHAADGTPLLDLEVDITAPPAAGPDEPLVLEFAIHRSAVDAVSAGTELVVFRNGTRVGPCADLDAAVADPDPCVVVTTADDVLDVRVLTTRASLWSFGAEPSGAICDRGSAAASFTDVAEGNVHRATIDCLARWTVVHGRGDGRYEPGGRVTRGQVAAVLARLIRAVGGELPRGTVTFSDVGRTHVHREDISALAGAQILLGGPGGDFRPDQAVTRGQLASLLVRTRAHLGGRTPEARADWFDDDAGSTHEVPINVARDLALVHGVADRRYAPVLAVRRDQLATAVAALLERLHDDGLVAG